MFEQLRASGGLRRENGACDYGGWFESWEEKEVERFLGRRAVKHVIDDCRTLFGKGGVSTASSAN